MICVEFTVLRIKNGFADQSAGVAFRQILINVAHTDPETGFVPFANDVLLSCRRRHRVGASPLPSDRRQLHVLFAVLVFAGC